MERDLEGLPGACSFAAESGEETSLGLFLSSIHGLNLHTPAHDSHQPLPAVHSKPSHVRIESSVPE